MGVGGQRHAPAAFTPEKDPIPNVQEAEWTPGPVSIGAENLAPTRIRSPDLPALSDSLYRLSYPDHVGKSGYREKEVGIYCLSNYQLQGVHGMALFCTVSIIN